MFFVEEFQRLVTGDLERHAVLTDRLVKTSCSPDNAAVFLCKKHFSVEMLFFEVPSDASIPEFEIVFRHRVEERNAKNHRLRILLGIAAVDIDWETGLEICQFESVG